MSRNDQSNIICDRWMDYVTFSSEASLPPEFQLHMETCPVCMDEWHQLQIVWEALALDTDHIEVPETLKFEVMNAIFADDSTDADAGAGAGDVSASASASASSSTAAKAISPSPIHRRRQRWIYAAAAACAVVGFGIWFALSTLRNQATPSVITPSQTVLQEWTLAPAQKTLPAAHASIHLVRDGDVQKVVVQAEGLAPTSGEQAYQVWLIYSDRRYNCGTFRVDKSGKGILIYDLKRPDVKIDGFGVTLEPDAQGTAPRGTKVLGTSNPS